MPMKVVAIESNYPEDFYKGRLDGALTHELLKLLQIQSVFRYCLDLEHFKRAVGSAARGGFDVVHVSCHGDKDGIALSDNTQLGWTEFVKCFQGKHDCPKALVMSSCCGIAAGIGTAFAKAAKRPMIIFGSSDERSHDEYAVAWALLYKEFDRGVNRDVAQAALRKIIATVHPSLMYRRWEESRGQYLSFPIRGRSYEVTECDLK